MEHDVPCLLLRPWLSLMRVMNAVPRCLADDRNLLALRAALQATHADLWLIGGRVSAGPGKSFLFSSEAATLERLDKARWGMVEDNDGRIEVLLHWRDLGGHADSTLARVGCTLRQRLGDC